ncbi:MAG: lysine--tRNA ligase [Dehalococcoidia bacterium]|nr:lysine--tRNA ligase [Dehalococcoidia bacterium]
MEEREIRIQKVAKLREQGVEPYPYRFERSHRVGEARRAWEERGGAGATGDAPAVRLAGRLVGVRRMGKANFAQLEDQDGRIQLYLSVDKTADFERFRDMVDRGDFLGVDGTLFLTRTLELTVEVRRFELLAKAVQPMPEKFHGLKDVEMMRRQRYVHLLSDAEARGLFAKRTRIITALRRYLDERGYLEMTTPVLQPVYGGAAARPFTTVHNELKRTLFLRIATELYLKRLIVGGYEKVYEVGTVFRNEGIDSTHNPEFTLLELYQAYGDYTDMMSLTEEMVRALAVQVNGSAKLPARAIGGAQVEIDLGQPWRRVAYLDAIKEYAGVDVSGVRDIEGAIAAARQAGVDTRALHAHTWEQVIGEIFDQRVEERLVQPTLVMDYPAGLCPLTKRHRSNPMLAERFELYIAGLETANAYSELTDPAYQAEQFAAQSRAASAGDEEAQPRDEDFLLALEYGMPPTGGLGIGVDRLVMLLTGATSVRDVLLFPQQRQAQE